MKSWFCFSLYKKKKQVCLQKELLTVQVSYMVDPQHASCIEILKALRDETVDRNKCPSREKPAILTLPGGFYPRLLVTILRFNNLCPPFTPPTFPTPVSGRTSLTPSSHRSASPSYLVKWEKPRSQWQCWMCSDTLSTLHQCKQKAE